MSALSATEAFPRLERPPVRVGIVISAADRRAYVETLAEQRRWIEHELGLDIFRLQPGNGEEYLDPDGYYRRTRTLPLLARSGGRTRGICCLKPLPGPLSGPGSTVELKRMFVRPEARGCGVGRALAEAAIDVARRRSVDRLVLETHEGFMPKAAALYRSLGFVEAAPLGVTHHADVLTMSLRLQRRAGQADVPAAHR